MKTRLIIALALTACAPLPQYPKAVRLQPRERTQPAISAHSPFDTLYDHGRVIVPPADMREWFARNAP